MRRTLLAACAALSIAATAAHAAPADDASASHGRHRRAPGEFACAIKNSLVATKISQARTELSITDAQSEAWARFDAAIAAAIAPLGEGCGRQSEARENDLPAHVARMSERAMMTATAMQGIQAAVDGLWPHLSAEQRVAAARMVQPARRRTHPGKPPSD